ncbi:MAG: diacylglycerol kinase family protein [Thermohalobaculum sp.]|nr:diacylglycerol kinase family protein [Thermohalobaculum sp.]
MTLTIGLIRNRASTRNLRGAAVPAAGGGVILRETGSLDELSGALADLRAAGVGLLILDGGDGTVREVVTRLPAIWREAPPRLAILAHGNTNLIARKTGAVRGAEGLARLVAAAHAGWLTECRLPVLHIAREGAPALGGFIAGWGVYETGSRLAAQEIAARGGGQVALAVAATLRRALFGREAAAIREGIAARLSVDGAALPMGPRLAGLVTTLPGALVMGLRPFWGVGAAPLRWLDVAAPGRRLALAAPFVLAGRPLGWMAEAGYRSGRAVALDLELGSGVRFVLDGEAFDPGPAGRLRLTAGLEASFVTPG